METTILKDANDVARAKAGWDAIADTSAALPTQTSMWMYACAVAFSEELHIVVLGDERSPDAIAPLVRRGSHMEMLGVMQLGEPTDILARTPTALVQITEQLMREGVAVKLPRVPANSESIAACREAIGRRGFVRAKAGDKYPSLPLSDAWLDAGGGLSSRRRADLRRARRRADSMGTVAFELTTPDTAQVAGLLRIAYDVEARSWKGRNGTAIACVPKLADFFSSYAASMASLDTMHVELLRINQIPAAMNLNIDYKGQAWVLKVGYDEQFAHASPGLLLLAESISEATRRGMERYEFLGHHEAWIDPWTREATECVNLAAYPASPRAAQTLAEDVIRKSRSWRGSRSAQRVSRAKSVITDG
jgi:CelD/BcsL family acetyltransferase involved in cellulose biosynthesis